ncbi:MAG: GC-type dockerin domain-anchored protein [Planctomycetota bacterium]
MNRFAVAATLAAFASPALAQNLAVSFQPTGEPNTYDMVAELFGPFVSPFLDHFTLDDVLGVWTNTEVCFTGDAPITIMEWNPKYDTAFGSPTVSGNTTADVTFEGIQALYVFGTPDSSNPMFVMRLRYTGTPSAFEARMVGFNSMAFATVPHPNPHHYTIDGELTNDELTHSFGPLPGVECTADINGDGALSPGDFNAWIIAFNNQSAGCDQNGDGACTAGDFNAWIINYNAGC